MATRVRGPGPGVRCACRCRLWLCPIGRWGPGPRGPGWQGERRHGRVGVGAGARAAPVWGMKRSSCWHGRVVPPAAPLLVWKIFRERALASGWVAGDYCVLDQWIGTASGHFTVSLSAAPSHNR